MSLYYHYQINFKVQGWAHICHRLPRLSVIPAFVKSATSIQPTSFASRIPIRKTSITRQQDKKVTITMKQKVKYVTVIKTVVGRKKKILTKENINQDREHPE